MSLLANWAMMGKHGLLPAAYQQVEYLESLHNTGNVEIPYTPQLGDGMRITVEFLSRERAGNCFHVGPGSGVRFSVRALLSGDNYIYTINMTSVTRAPIKQTNLNVWYTVEMRGDGVCTATDTATGTILGTTNNPQTTVPDGNMIYLFTLLLLRTAGSPYLSMAKLGGCIPSIGYTQSIGYIRSILT